MTKRMTLAAALCTVAKQALPVHANDRREVEIIDEGAILDDVGRLILGLEAAPPQPRAEVQA